MARTPKTTKTSPPKTPPSSEKPSKRRKGSLTKKAAKAGVKKPGKSTTGRINPVVDQSGWRKKLQQSRIKFDDQQKTIFLRAFAKDNLKFRAAEKAGVSLRTIKNHYENDPEFAELFDAAVDSYRDQIVDHHRGLVLDGEIHKRFNGKGEIIEEKHVYPIRLIELELKRVDHEFRERSSVDLTHAGGVMIAPAEVTPEKWIEEQEEANAAKDAPEGVDDE